MEVIQVKVTKLTELNIIEDIQDEKKQNELYDLFLN